MIIHSFSYTLQSVASMSEKEGNITVSKIPNEWSVQLAGVTCNYGALQSWTIVNSTTIKIKCINLSNGTHTLTGIINLIYSPYNVITY